MKVLHTISFRSKIFISLILVSMITIFTSSLIVLSTTSNNTEEELIESYSLYVTQISTNLSYIFLDMLNIANDLAGDEALIDLILHYNDPQFEYEQVVTAQSISDLLPQRTNNYVVALETIITTIDGDIFYSGAQEFFYQYESDDILVEPWFSETFYTSGNLGFHDSSQMFDIDNKANYFYITRSINDAYTGEQLAAIRLGFSSDYIQYLITNIINTNYTSYILNDDNYILCSNDSNLIGTTFDGVGENAIDASNYILIESQIDNTPWTLLVAVPYSNLHLDLSSILLALFFSILLALLVSGVVSFFVSQSIATPINKLSDKVRAINIKGFKQLEIPVENKDEIAILGDSIDHMSKYMDDIMDNLILKERQKDEAEVNFLRMQISPHFLHNTLKTMPYLVKHNRLEENTTIVTSLTTILRESMIGSSSMIPLSKELDLLRKYLMIMQVRYDYSFDFSIEDFPAFSNILIPRLTLQPLVENAVFHATSSDTSFLNIKVHVKNYEEDETKMHITICDDGCGINESKLNFINQTIEHYELFSKQEGSIGVPNVAKRLKYYYDEPIMFFESEVNKGTCVNLIISKIEEENHENSIS